MADPSIGLKRRYVAELRRYVAKGPGGGLTAADRLGKQAVANGLETLDLVRIHEEAFERILLEANTTTVLTGLLKQAGLFFAQAATHIEQTHRAAREAKNNLQKMTVTLARRTSGLAAAQRTLKRRISQRKNAEETLRKSVEHDATLVKESLKLQQELRKVTHRIITARELEKKLVSQDLQEKFAQTLVGINVRLLALRSAVLSHARDFELDLNSTQQLVGDSVKLMARYSHAP